MIKGCRLRLSELDNKIHEMMRECKFLKFHYCDSDKMRDTVIYNVTIEMVTPLGVYNSMLRIQQSLIPWAEDVVDLMHIYVVYNLDNNEEIELPTEDIMTLKQLEDYLLTKMR